MEGEVGKLWRVGSAPNKIYFNNSISVAASCWLTQWKAPKIHGRGMSVLWDVAHEWQTLKFANKKNKLGTFENTSGNNWRMLLSRRNSISHIRFMFRLAKVIIFSFCHHFSSDGCWWAKSVGENVSAVKMLCVSRTALDLSSNWLIMIRTLAVITRPQRCLPFCGYWSVLEPFLCRHKKLLEL